MAGTVNQELGLLFQGPNYVIVKKGGKAGEKVENITTQKQMSSLQ